jgi:hypothetical protein
MSFEIVLEQVLEVGGFSLSEKAPGEQDLGQCPAAILVPLGGGGSEALRSQQPGADGEEPKESVDIGEGLRHGCLARGRLRSGCWRNR